MTEGKVYCAEIQVKYRQEQNSLETYLKNKATQIKLTKHPSLTEAKEDRVYHFISGCTAVYSKIFLLHESVEVLRLFGTKGNLLDLVGEMGKAVPHIELKEPFPVLT